VLGEIGGNFLHLTFYWHCLKKTQKDINVFFDLIDDKGKLTGRFLRPICYRAFPTNAWQRGQFIKEERYFILPIALRSCHYLLKMGFFDYATMQLCRTDSQDSLGRIDLSEIEIKRR